MSVTGFRFRPHEMWGHRDEDEAHIWGLGSGVGFRNQHDGCQWAGDTELGAWGPRVGGRSQQRQGTKSPGNGGSGQPTGGEARG